MHQTIIIMKEEKIKHQKAQKKILSSRWDSNSDNALEFTIGRFTTELLEGAGSKFYYYTPAREDYVYQILVQNQLYITFDYQQAISEVLQAAISKRG